MRNLILIFSLSLLPILCSGQEVESKLKFHSISIAPNLYAANSNTGFMGNLDLAASIKEHIFKLSTMAASEVDICVWGPCLNDEIYSFDVMYGREFLKDRKLAIDLFAGVGYFNLKTQNREANQSGYISKKTIGFPVQARLRLREGKEFNLGLQLHGNINAESSLVAIGPFFQWTFNPVKKEM